MIGSMCPTIGSASTNSLCLGCLCSQLVEILHDQRRTAAPLAFISLSLAVSTNPSYPCHIHLCVITNSRWCPLAYYTPQSKESASNSDDRDSRCVASILVTFLLSFCYRPGMPWTFFIIGCLTLILLVTVVVLCCLCIRQDRRPWRCAPQSPTIPETAADKSGKGCRRT
ncbi:hypothetical protein CPB85DRAFT_222749 [Mucidula mucida]|nr:hypothetical protein CPB85DRAFT_222749 [Mucidula mucida]